MRRNCCLCKGRKGGTVTIHQFPANKKYRQLWIQNIRKKYAYFNPSERDILCSQHFLPEHLMKYDKMTILAKNAVPTIFNLSENPKTTRKSPRERLPLAAITSGLRPLIPSSVDPDVKERAMQILAKRKAAEISEDTSKIQKIVPPTVVPEGLITSVKDNHTLIPHRNKANDRNLSVVPLSVKPDVRDRALQILARRKADKRTAETAEEKLARQVLAKRNKEKKTPISTSGQADFEIWPNSLVAKPEETKKRGLKILKRNLTKEQILKATVKTQSYKIKLLTQKIKRLAERIDVLKNEKRVEEPSLRLSDLLTVSRSKKRKYSPEIKDFALMLHTISPRAYSFVRRNFLQVLPSFSALRQWRKEMQRERNIPLCLEVAAEEIVGGDISVENIGDEAWEAANNII